MTTEELDEAGKRVWLEIRKASLVEVDALLLAGWKFELPEIVNGWGGETEPWQWYWRSPPKRRGSKGRKYWSTTQAFNALRRRTKPS